MLQENRQQIIDPLLNHGGESHDRDSNGNPVEATDLDNFQRGLLLTRSAWRNNYPGL